MKPETPVDRNKEAKLQQLKWKSIKMGVYIALATMGGFFLANLYTQGLIFVRDTFGAHVAFAIFLASLTIFASASFAAFYYESQKEKL